MILDATTITALGASAAAVLAALGALIKTLREPTTADVLRRVVALEGRVVGIVRWYADVRARSAAEGVELPAMPPQLLMTPR